MSSPYSTTANSVNCGDGGGADTHQKLRIASIFIILTGSMMGASFPVLSKRHHQLYVPKAVFDFAKYFGSGVIIATGFIHLLSPALSELGSPCLSPAWSEYPYALALCLLSIFSIFIVEVIAFRWGTAKLAKLGIHPELHPHHAPRGSLVEGGDDKEKGLDSNNVAVNGEHPDAHSAMAQIIGVAILEFGVLLHSVLIGLTLAVDPDFKILFIVIIFHQTFEGLGIGSRLAYLQLSPEYNWIRYLGAILYGVTTPIGIAAGLGVKTTYNPGSATASIVSGVMDAFSSGILIYTGLVELLAHEFLFNREMMGTSNGQLAYLLTCMLSGCAIMALLGKWA